jgi:hypothetical protein
MGYPAVVIVLAMFAGRMALAAAYPSGRRARREQKSSEISLEPSNDSLVLGSWSSWLISSSHCSGVTDSVLDDAVRGRLGSSMFM